VTKKSIGPPLHPTTPTATSRQLRKLLFGMQSYFDPTRKMTSKQVEDDLKKKLKKTGRRPQKNMKMEDDLNLSF
jgi:hypothetical protein